MNDSTGYPNGLVATANAIKINPTQTVSDEVNANARLIAASPRLLAALERLARDYAAIERELNDITGNQTDGQETDQSYTDALQAIAEAKGLTR